MAFSRKSITYIFITAMYIYINYILASSKVISIISRKGILPQVVTNNLLTHLIRFLNTLPNVISEISELSNDLKGNEILEISYLYFCNVFSICIYINVVKTRLSSSTG